MSAPSIPSGAVCAKCGGGVDRNEEGRVVCSGCGIATENCTCASQQS